MNIETSVGSNDAVAIGADEHQTGRDAIAIYLSEIGRTKLLTPDEEKKLFKKIKAGDKKAREHMIKANLRFVVKIAKDYEGLGLPLLDLISEGNIGLMKAVERFDSKFGAKLTTYSSWWIKQAIRRALANQSKTVRLPVHMIDKISKVNKVTQTLHIEFGREPTNAEIAGELNVSEAYVLRLKTVNQKSVSLDAPIGDDGDVTIAGTIEDGSVVSVAQVAEIADGRALLGKMLTVLTPREVEVISYRFGLDGKEMMTLEQIGSLSGVTRERIRQIESKAIRKLRKKHHSLLVFGQVDQAD